MAFNNFEQLFQDLKNNETGYANFNSSTLQGLSGIIDTFWKELLEKLSEEPLGEDSIFANNDTKSYSVLYGIQDKIDLGLGESLIDWIEMIAGDPGHNNGFWNESVALLASEYLDFFNKDDTIIIGGITVDDIKHGDAGNSFAAGGQWVKAWKNASNETYKQVRGNDLLEVVVTYSDNLSYTNDKGKLALRLLMPKYIRYLEVEDLNRNFWVTSQALTGLCNFIFSDNGLKPILEDLLNEVVQLWQNVEYLWGAYALLSQKPYYTDVHCEIVPVPVDSVRNYVKFDDFARINSLPTTETAARQILQNIWSNMIYLKDTYLESNLCIIPIIRFDNYKHNYYRTEYYPGVILYDRNLDSSYYKVFKDSDDNVAKGIRITPPLYAKYIGALNEDSSQYGAPYGNISTPEGVKLYGILRIKPSILETTYGDNFNHFKLNLDIYDVATEVADQNRNLHKITNYSCNVIENLSNNNSITLTRGNLPSSSIQPQTLAEFNMTKGHYKGELATDDKGGRYIPYVVTNYSIKVYPTNNNNFESVVFSLKDENNNEQFQAHGYSNNQESSGVYILTAADFGYQDANHNLFYGRDGGKFRIYFNTENNINAENYISLYEDSFEWYVFCQEYDIGREYDPDRYDTGRSLVTQKFIEFEIGEYDGQGGIKFTSKSEDLNLNNLPIGTVINTTNSGNIYGDLKISYAEPIGTDRIIIALEAQNSLKN